MLRLRLVPSERRPWLIFAALVLALVCLVVTVWGFGGFRRRTDLLQLTPPGTLLTTGPYEFRFTSVTAQQRKSFDNTVYWQLSALGTGRTTGDVSIAPDYGASGTFVSQDPRSRRTVIPTGIRYGPSGSFTEGAQFTPGLPPKQFAVDFRYPSSYVPQSTLRFAVFQLQFGNRSLLGDDEEEWHKTNVAFDLRLPIQVLPAAPG